MPRHLALVPSSEDFGRDAPAPGTARRTRPTRSILEQAQDFLDHWDVPYEMPKPTHLKVGEVNFYAPRGTVTIDGEGASPGKGLVVFEAACRRKGLVD